jgi:hypothetical protein
MSSPSRHRVARLLGHMANSSARGIAQGLDLRRRLDATVGSDLLENPNALFELVRARGVLSRFFRSFVRKELAHFFLVLEPSLEGAHGDTAKNGDANDDHEENEKGRRQVTLLD